MDKSLDCKVPPSGLPTHTSRHRKIVVFKDIFEMMAGLLPWVECVSYSVWSASTDYKDPSSNQDTNSSTTVSTFTGQERCR